MIRPLPHPTSSTRIPVAIRSASPGMRGRTWDSSEERTLCPLSSAMTAWNRFGTWENSRAESERTGRPAQIRAIFQVRTGVLGEGVDAGFLSSMVVFFSRALGSVASCRFLLFRDVHQETLPLRARLPDFFGIDPARQTFRLQHLQRLAIQIFPVPVVVNPQVDTISHSRRLHGLVDDGDRRPAPDDLEQPGDILGIQPDASLTAARPDTPRTIRAVNQQGPARKAERVAPQRIVGAGGYDGREIGAFPPDRMRQTYVSIDPRALSGAP